MSESAPDQEPAAEESGPPAEAEQPEFVNRAARRAKGKDHGKAAAFEKGQQPIGRGSVQSPRQYGTRRSG
jgi:hypothetical protein